MRANILSPSRFLLTLCASGHFGRQLPLWQWTVPHVSYPALRQHQALVKGKTAWHIQNVKFEVATLDFFPGAYRSQQAEMAENSPAISEKSTISGPASPRG